MSSFAEKLAAARAQRPSKDVQVVLDGEITAERDKLLERLEAVREAGSSPDARLGKKTEQAELVERIESLTEAARDSIVTLRFTRLPGSEWAELSSHYPVRTDANGKPSVPLDLQYGYNFDAVCEEAARRSGVRIEDDVVVEMVVETPTKKKPNPLNEWDELFDAISGSDMARIRDAIYSLNEYEPALRVQALVKGFGAAAGSSRN